MGNSGQGLFCFILFQGTLSLGELAPLLREAVVTLQATGDFLTYVSSAACKLGRSSACLFQLVHLALANF